MLAFGELSATFRHTHEKRRVAFWIFLVDGRVGLAVACDFAFGGAFGLLSAALGRGHFAQACCSNDFLCMPRHVEPCWPTCCNMSPVKEIVCEGFV